MTLIETHLAETHRPTKKYSSIFVRVKSGIARFFRASPNPQLFLKRVI